MGDQSRAEPLNIDETIAQIELAIVEAQRYRAEMPKLEAERLTLSAALLWQKHVLNRHDWTFAENGQRFSRIDKRLNDMEADIRAMADRLKSVIRLEVGKQARLLETQAARQSQRPPAP